ncbi:MAG TPA: LysR family transcriptional regulator [Ilumatobacter sp.]|nr:LysR family transcriptional regulator [Ilumatobacter sp.]
MELRHLRYYVAVAEECHFGRAAARLHIAQPPLSQQIKQLETELGARLLRRTTRKVELTEAGARYLDKARTVLALVDEAAAEAAAVAAGLAGRLTIGFTGSATYQLLPELSRVLRKELPDLELELRGELLTPDQVESLLDHTLDIGLLRPPVRNHAINVRVLRREALIAVVPDRHPLARLERIPIAEMRHDPFVSYPSRDRSVVYDAVFDTCRAAGFLPREVHEVAETSTLVSFVAAGLGVALVPQSVEHLQVTGATFRPLAEPTDGVELAVATRSDDDSPQTARVLALIETLISGHGADPAE